MLTKEAWNAFLKTLEEPPPNTVFVLATTEAHKVMATIADRCQRFDFQRPSLEQIAEVVRRVAAAEEIEVDDGAVAMIARSATGSFRDALGDSRPAGRLRRRQGRARRGAGAARAPPTRTCSSRPSTPSPPRMPKAILEAVETACSLGPRPGPVRPRPARPPAPPAGDPDDRRGPRHLRRHRIADPTACARSRRRSAPRPWCERSTSWPESLAAMREGDDARLAVELALLKSARPDLDPSGEGLLRRVGEAGAAAWAREAAHAPSRSLPPRPSRKPRPSRSPRSASEPASEPESASDERPKEPGPESRERGSTERRATPIDLERCCASGPLCSTRCGKGVGDALGALRGRAADRASTTRRRCCGSAFPPARPSTSARPRRRSSASASPRRCGRSSGSGCAPSTCCSTASPIRSPRRWTSRRG